MQAINQLSDDDVWQMIECYSYWLDDDRPKEQVNACLNMLVDNCRAAAARLPEDDDERFKIFAVVGLLEVLGYHGTKPPIIRHGSPDAEEFFTSAAGSA